MRLFESLKSVKKMSNVLSNVKKKCLENFTRHLNLYNLLNYELCSSSILLCSAAEIVSTNTGVAINNEE